LIAKQTTISVGPWRLPLKKIFLGVAIILVPIVLYASHRYLGNTEQKTEYLTTLVERGIVRSEITATGTVKPLVEVLVGSQLSGTVKELHADFESTVTKDQLIALIDPAMFKAERDQALADLAAAKAALNQARVTVRDEQRTLTRKTGLVANNSISQSEFDTAKTNADRAEAQVLAEEARVEQMEAKLRKAQTQLDYTRILAPVNGVVTLRSVDAGQTVAASFQAPVLFKIAEDLSRMQVHASIDEADIGRVEPGKKATFTVPAFPGETFGGTVKQVRNEPKIEQNVVTYTVILDVENRSLKLRPGMTANVTILLAEAKGALLVPEAALRFKPVPVKKSRGRKKSAHAVQSRLPLDPNVEQTVWRLGSDGNPAPVKVRIGIQGSEMVQVLSKDLKPDDRLFIQIKREKMKKKLMKGFRF
jgi:HlyD family secretion protein